MIAHTVYLHNYTPVRIMQGKLPEEARNATTPELISITVLVNER